MASINSSDTNRCPDIVVIVSAAVVGGHEQQAYHLINDLISGANVTVVCSSEQIKEYYETLPCSVVTANFLKEGKIWKQFWYARTAANILRKYVRDANKVIVSGGTIEATICPVYACKAVKSRLECIAYVPMYIDRSITHGFVGKLYNCVIDLIGRRPDAYCTINKIQAYILKKRLNKRVFVLPNKIREVSQSTQSFGKRLVYVGRFDDQQKDLTSLLLMLDCQENPYKEMLMIGSGPAENKLKNIAMNSKYLHVTFLPWLNSQEMDNKLGLEDCLVLNSRWEGEPLVVREFIARGLFCVSKNIAGVRGVVDKELRFNNDCELLRILSMVYSCNTTKLTHKPSNLLGFRRSRAIQELLFKK